jgi:hypothetical protein
MQHKTQLGANKFISKVRVFKPDIGSLPYMLFYVETPAPVKPGFQVRMPRERAPHRDAEARNDTGKSHVLKQSIDGKNFVSEHIFRVNI